MIVASVHDPEVFSKRRFDENSLYMGFIKQRLVIMNHCHLMIVDDSEDGSVIAKKMRSNLLEIPQMQLLVNAVLQPQRIVRLPVDNIRKQKIKKWIEDAGSAESVALAGHDGVDVCVVDPGTLEAINEEEISKERITTLDRYDETEAFQRENRSFGGTPVSDLTKIQFIENIVKPVVVWAKELTVVDKMIGRSSFGDANDPRGRSSSNWNKFNQTLKAIFDQWDAGPFSDGNKITIITETVTHVMKDENPVLGDDLAVELARRLTIPTPRIRVLLKHKEQIKHLNHDRYLVTNHGFVVGITRGFDLLKDDDRCEVSDVFLRQDQKRDDVLQKIINSDKGTAGVFPKSSR